LAAVIVSIAVCPIEIDVGLAVIVMLVFFAVPPSENRAQPDAARHSVVETLAQTSRETNRGKGARDKAFSFTSTDTNQFQIVEKREIK
jgi:hypothetical protein